MAETSSFFNSISGDRKYKAEDWAAYFSSFIGNGVFPDPSTGLQVVDDENMVVSLSAGSGWINGYYYNNSASLALTVGTADGVLNRIDNVVLRWDLTERSITAQVIAGTPASTAAAPAIVRTAEQYDLKLAEISVAAGTTAITQAMITDTRQDSAVCGIVTGLIDQIDVTNLFAQYGTAFTEWFDEIKDQLSTDAAGALQNQINNITGSFSHSLSGTVHALTGSFPVSSGITTLKFKATAGYTSGDTFTVNGTAYTAAMQGGESMDTDAFITGDVVQVGVDLDAQKLVFKGGGVTLTGDLTPPYAASGYTFYSDDPKTKLTGTGAAAKRYVTGTVTASSTKNKSYYYSQSTSTVINYDTTYSVTISNLGFIPSTIVLAGTSTTSGYTSNWVYDVNLMVYGKSDTKIMTIFDNEEYGIKGSSATITENSLVLPVPAYSAGLTYTYRIFE